MSLSPRPPTQGRSVNVDAPAQAASSYESDPHSTAIMYGSEYNPPSPAHQMPIRTAEEPFSSAAAYRSTMSPGPSPLPRTSSPMSPKSNLITHQRAVALQSPPLASSLVVHDSAASSSPSLAAQNGAPSASPAAQHSNRRDARSAYSSATRDGTASMTKTARSSATSWLYGGPNSFVRVPSRNAAAYILVSTVEAIIVIVLVGFIFGRIVSEVDNFTQNLKTISVYLAVFVFGCVFQVLIAWDAVRLKNTLQLIGVLIFNIALTITAAIEIRQVRGALNAQDRLVDGGVPCADDPNQICQARSLFPSVERYLIVVTVLCFVAEIAMAWLSVRLWKEFGWVIYQKIGADLKVRRMFFWYQLFIVFLKFSFFFGVGFTIIYLILVADTTQWEYGVTIAAVPIAVVSLFAAGFAVRREWTSLMVLSLFLMIAGLVYFVYKVTQVWVPATRAEYTYVHTTITFISAFAILSLSLTLINGIVCLLNFHRGLKPAHDAIGTFGGVHRQRARAESEGKMLDLEPNTEPKEEHPIGGDAPYHRASLGGAAGPKRQSAFVHTPVYSTEGYASTPGVGTEAAPPVHAPLQPHSFMGSPLSTPPPPQHQVYPPLPDAHHRHASASRISLD